MLRAASDLGFGDDWRAALEHVKDLHVGPGEQPQLVHDLAWEAVEFLEQRDLVTIPELCKETWRMEMLSPERQKSMPTRFSGLSGKSRSHSSISQYSAHPSPQNGVLNARRCVR